MANSNEAPWQCVQEKAAQELIRTDGHLALPTAMSIILVAKRDLTVFEGDQAMVGNGNAMRVTSKILKDVLRPAEWPLGIHDPVLPE